MAGVREQQLGAVVDRFYEAAAQPELWRGVLHEASTVFGAEGASLLAVGVPGLQLAASEGLDELAAEFVRGGWHLKNARAERVLARRGAGLLTELDVFSPEELDWLPLNAELFNPLGFRWATAAMFPVAEDGLVILTVERLARQGQFSGRELSGIRAVLPHLRRALQITAHLARGRAEGMLDSFESIGCGAILLDQAGRVRRLNAGAQREIGKGLRVVGGVLRASDPRVNPALQRLIGSVLYSGPAHEAAPIGALAVPRAEGSPLVLHGVPVLGTACELFQSCKAVLLLVDPDEHREPGEVVLRQAYGLTPSEAQVAIRLGRGHDLEEIAAERGVSLTTTRSQLLTVFAKTATHRQSELTALLARMALVPPGARIGS